MRGHFENDLPWVDIEVQGIEGSKPRKIRVVVDTGNNGYVSLPYQEAFPIGLRLDGVQASTLADGSSATHLVCRGIVTLGDKKAATAIDVYPKGPMLIGNNLLKALGLQLISDIKSGRVELIDSEAPISKDDLPLLEEEDDRES